MSIQEYREFIASRAPKSQMQGFTPKPINNHAKSHQVAALEFALRRGKSAAFLDTGLGKSFIELQFARQCAEETRKPSLILTPLAVAGQMVREGQKFGIEARQIREQHEIGAGVMVANYERLPKLDPNTFGAVILDESSILKSFAGCTRNMLMEAFADTPYKLAATATPSPNDHMELGNHAEFLGVMRQQEMLSKWFINDTKTASQEWRLKGHAAQDFWQWVSSWSRCATLPSDLGGDDDGYILPPIDERLHMVEADRSQDAQGMLFRIPEMSATSFHAEKRLTLQERCNRVLQVAFSDLCSKLATAILELEECRGSRNTQNADAKNIESAKMSEIGAKPKGERQSKTQNTCVNTTRKTAISSGETLRRSADIMKGAESDTQPIMNMPSASGSQSEAEIPQSAGTKSCALTTEYPNLTTIECLQIKTFLAKFVEQSTKKSEAGNFTLITATPTDTSGGCYAHRVTLLLEKCAMMLNGSSQQYDTLKKILLDPVLVFCETNEEQDLLERLASGIAISVRGSQSEDVKERGILDWCDGAMPWLISKSSIVGFGMNFQHCATVIFASINFSYEKFYQAKRRVYRFGQKRQVIVHTVISDTEYSIWEAVNVKGKKHEEMKRAMSEAMRGAQTTAQVRVKYDRPLDLAFPEWIKAEGAAS